MNKRLALILTAVVAAILAAPISSHLFAAEPAATPAPEAAPIILIQNATILTVSHGTIDLGDFPILNKDGAVLDRSVRDGQDRRVLNQDDRRGLGCRVAVGSAANRWEEIGAARIAAATAVRIRASRLFIAGSFHPHRHPRRQSTSRLVLLR